MVKEGSAFRPFSSLHTAAKLCSYRHKKEERNSQVLEWRQSTTQWDFVGEDAQQQHRKRTEME